MKLFYRTFGQGKPVIILHGLFGFSDNWVTFAKNLGKENYQVFLPDQRNHGNSQHSEVWDYEAMSKDLLEFIQDHKIQNPILVGHSMGGKTMMDFCLRFQDIAERVVVIDIAPKKYAVHQHEILAGLNSIDLKSIKKRSEAEESLKNHIPEFSVRQFLLKNLARDEENGFRWKMNLKVIEEKVENVVDAVHDAIHETIDILFIRGGKSDYIQGDDFEHIKRRFPKAKLITYDNAGHWLHAEEPQRLHKDMIAFF